MNEGLRQRARRLFMELGDLSGSARAEAIARACAGDEALRAEVENLFRLEERAEGFLASPTGVLSTDEHPTLDRPSGVRVDAGPAIPIEREGQVIGRYKLLQQIGEGGFGAVWMAEQREPVKRRVALKVIKLGMDTRQVIARFEAERQALAMMDHPHIAKVFDAGSTETGRPYFVMEYIRGVPILEYCDSERLDTRARLQLFTQVCNAIQHAHAKGIIHRDVKPSNVLVTLHDGVPVPKVIDFGIAKATGSELTQKTLFTEHRQMVGTPAYMSPEQAEMSGLDIDTRSDIYSLGVLLYELLTGTTPFETRELLSKGFAEMMRIIREVEPRKPSTRLSELGDVATESAQQRSAGDPRRLSTILRGDLDWIVMKCLEKDRTRRYETASGLAADVLRHLGDEPVSAGPPSKAYRFRKFVKRHRKLVIAGTAVALALLIGVIGTSAGMVMAYRSAGAERIAKTEAERRRKEAETNLEFAKNGNAILGSVFAKLDPRQNYQTVAEFRGTLRGNLDDAAAELGKLRIGDPAEVASMQHTLGISLLGLGEAAKAIPLLEQAGATREASLGREHPDTLRCRSDLAFAYRAAGKVDLALPLAKETYERRKTALGPENADTLGSMEGLAGLYCSQRQFDRAISLAEEAVEIRTRTAGADNLATLFSMETLASIREAADRPADALPLREEIARRLEVVLGPDHPNTLSAKGNLARAYERAGKRDLAVPLYEQTLRLQREKLGRDHPSTLLTMGNLAIAYQKTGKPELAVLLYEETLKLREATLGPDHPETIGAMNHLAGAYSMAGKPGEALALFERALAFKKVKFGPDHLDTLRGMEHLAQLYLNDGQPDKAIMLWTEALGRRRTAFGSDDPETLETMGKLGQALRQQGKYAEAEPLLLEAVRRLSQSTNSSAATRLPGLIDGLIVLYQSTNKPTEAAKWQAERAKRP